MFIIREDQFEAFEKVGEEILLERTITHLRENHEEETLTLPSGQTSIKKLTEENLVKLVKSGLIRARKYGLTWESSLIAFVTLMFVIAPNFDEQSAIQKVLRDESIEPDLRIDNVWDRTSNEDWDNASKNYQPECWLFS